MLLVLFGVFVLLIFLGTPIAFAIGLSTFASLATEGSIPLLVVAQRFFTTLDSFSFVSIPLFILAGEIMTHTGLTSKIVRFAVTIVGHIRGGFAQVTVLTSLLFSGISGSASADVSAVGSLLIPAMKQEKYDPGFAVALTATAASLGPIVPPSIMMIIYGSMTGVSIGKLFIAGILPALLLTLLLMIYCYYYAKKHHLVSTTERSSFKDFWVALKEAIWALILPIIIIGGVRVGAFSPTEAGVIGVAYAFVLGLIQKTLKLKDMPKLFIKASILSTVSLMILAASAAFGWILANQLFPQMAVKFMTSISTEPMIVLVMVMVGLLIVGLFLEAPAAVIILIPVLLGIQQSFHFDPLHFAVIVILTLVIGGMHPPVGNILIIAQSIGKVKTEEVFWKVWPFIGIMVATVILLVVFPGIVTFLPNLLK